MRSLRKVVVLVLGGSVLLVGVLMIVLPGPALLIIPAGLAILAVEFSWARKLLQATRARIRASADALKRTDPPPNSAPKNHTPSDPS